MPRRVLAAALELVLALLIAYGLAGLLQFALGGDAVSAFTTEAFALLFTFAGAAIVTWIALLVVGAIRGRGLGWGALGGILAALVAGAVNLVAVIVLALISGGADIFLIAIGIEAGVLFVIGALIAVPLVQRLVKPSGAPLLAT